SLFPTHLSRRMVKVLVRISIVLGFCYQQLAISIEYFSYPTTTIVTMESWQPTTHPPRIVIVIDNDQAIVCWNVSDAFGYIRDTSRIIDSDVKGERIRSHHLVKMTN